MKKFPTFFIALITLFFSSQSQDIVKRCALDDINTQTLSNSPTLTSTYLREISNGINNIVAYDTTLANTDTVYTVQVVVHVVYLNNNKYENIPDDIIQSQIDALNRDYNAQNADSVNLRPFFVPFRGNARIKFELAKKAPNGAVSNGITRTLGKLGNLRGWDPISTLLWTALGIEPLKEDFFLFTGSNGKSPWPAKDYINIYVCDLNNANRKCATCVTLCDTCGALGGFAYPPSNATNWGALATDHGKNDGIVIDFRFFGQNNWYAQDSTSQRFRDFYSHGRTVVHEVGHYFGLQHTWGNVLPLPGFDDGCAIDDFMDDTPEEFEAFANNLVRGTLNPCDTSVNTCNKIYLGRDWPDMYEDYMDYSTDLCYNLFTKQQVNIMRYNLLTRRQYLITKRELEPTLPTSIRNPKLKDAGISIYPNPAKEILTIHFDRVLNNDVAVDVVDITGKIVSSSIIKQHTFDSFVDVKSLASGVYLIKLSNSDFTSAAKFIKE